MKTLLTAAAVALGAVACGGDDPEPVAEEPTVEEQVRDAVAEAADVAGLPVGRAMPCAADEVYVWVDYEAGEAECVAGTDHAAHAGHG